MSDVKVKITADSQELKTGLEKARGHVSSFADGLSSKLAGLFAVGGITTAIRAVMDYTSAIQDSADRLNLSTDAVQGLTGAFALSGAKAEVVDKALVKLNQSLEDARNNVGPARDAFEKLGVSWAQIRDSSPEEMLYIIADAMKDAKDPTAALAAVMDILGKAGAKLTPGLKAGSDELKNFVDEVHKISPEDVKLLDDVGDKLAKIGTGLKVMGAHAIRTALTAGAAIIAGPKVFTGGEVVAETDEEMRARVKAERAAIEKAKMHGPTMEELRAAPPAADPREVAAKKKADAEADKSRKEDARERVKLADEELKEAIRVNNALFDLAEKRTKKLAEEKKKQLEDHKASVEKERDQAEAAAKQAKDALVRQIESTPEQRRQDRAEERQRRRTEQSLERMRTGKQVSAKPGVGRAAKEADKAQAKLDKIEGHLDKLVRQLAVA